MLNASIVLYHHTLEDIQPIICALRQASRLKTIFLLDNSPVENAAFRTLPVQYIFTGTNLGYGAAHNIALRKTIEERTPYHLVLNPDIRLESSALDELLDYLKNNPRVGHLMPKVLYPNGATQYLCKLLPTPFDLFVRRFLPPFLFQQSKQRFELRASGYNRVMDVPYLSGCFMLLRAEALEAVGLFDERFFMYPEDIDLTRRMHRMYRTVFYPHATVVHAHARGSYRSFRMLAVHLGNIIRYFNKWGWFLDSERKKINQETLRKLDLLN